MIDDVISDDVMQYAFSTGNKNLVFHDFEIFVYNLCTIKIPDTNLQQNKKKTAFLIVYKNSVFKKCVILENN